MCGLVGIFDLRARREIDRTLLSRMNARLVHRGPDGEGLYVSDGVGLAHRRLAIIDLAGGAQPMFNEDETVIVVFVGEIYNYRELVAELKALGNRFRTQCDTEVIVHAWEAWGDSCVDRFRGMFTFALFDESKETLFLARDRLGKKPLYYAALPDGLVLFASELKALLLHPSIERKLDAQAVEEYFAFGYVPDPRSIYRGIAKLPPAHTLTLRRGQNRVEPRRYWDVHFTDTLVGDEAELCEELVGRFREAVEMRMVADVPLGAFLSGGVDSSGTVAMAAASTQRPLRTFCVSFAARDYDESSFASELAKRYRTNHAVKRVDLDSSAALDRLADIYDEPFGDSSALPTERICAAAREQVTVAISGDGGDEIFAGYRRYRWHRHEESIRSWLPSSVRRPLFGGLSCLYPKLDRAPRPLRAKSTFRELAADSVEGYFLNVSMIKDGLRQRLYSPGFRRELQGYHALEVIARHMRSARSDDPVAQAQYTDIQTYLPGDILTKVDRASMANSLEVRAPILDHQFVEWSAGLPRAWKLRGGQGKHILKKALEPYVPAKALYRPKQGFSVPLAAWLRGPLRESTRSALNGSVLRDSGLLDTTFIARLLDQHLSGARDHSTALWSILCFEAFLRRVHNGARAA